MPIQLSARADAQRLVEVERRRDADRRVPKVRVAGVGARQVRRLGLHVDVAGGGAAADVRAGRPHEHLDLLEVEDVARDQPVVAHVVDEQAVRRR